MARYRQGSYIVEEGYAMIDQDGERAHQQTFAETPAEASRLLWSALGYDVQEGDMDTWNPGTAVLVTDTGVDYRSKITKDTVVPLGVWERYGDPYIF
jgi:hypothetical protein